MDLRQLKAIVTVAETGSVTQAAELLHLVQPAVTRQIRALEDELGVPLFERTRHGMQLTDAGRTMVDRARRALHELDRAQAEVRPLPGVVSGIVTVGLLESTASLLVEPLTTAIAREYPDIELRLMTAYSGHLQTWLNDGDLDLSLLYNLANTPSLCVEPLASERLWAVAGPEAELDPTRPLPLADVAARPVILPTIGHGLRTLIDQACNHARIALDAVAQTNSMHVQKQLVSSGHGWTILPGVGIADDVAAGTLSAAPICEPDIDRLVVLGTPRTGRVSAAAKVVTEQIVHDVRAAVAGGRWPLAQPADAEP